MKVKFSKDQKNMIVRIIIAFVLLVISLILPDNILKLKIDVLTLVIDVAAALIVGLDVFQETFEKMKHKNFFNEESLMALAIIGAFGTGQFNEAVEVMIFYQIGELFQDVAVDRSRDSISELMKMCPDKANVMRNGKIETVDPDEVEIGESVIVKPGEKIPIDSVITKGHGSVDNSALTGESVPVEVSEGDEVLSGSINLNSVLELKTTKEFGESTASKILELVENASEKKSSAENFVQRFAKYYTPIVVILAACVAFLPPLFTFITGGGNEFVMWLKRALIFLVVSCPCAIVISVPLTFFGSIGGSSKDGILIKGGNSLEDLAKAKIVVMDKTGTITQGKFAVSKISPVGVSEDELIKYAAIAENFSNHPIALSLKAAYGKKIDQKEIEEVEEIAGFGVQAKYHNKIILVGKAGLMEKFNIEYQKSDFVGTICYVAIDGKYVGCIGIADKIKPDSKQAIADLKKVGVRQTVMLTGDADNIGQYVAKEVGLDKAYTKLLPADKVDRMMKLRNSLNKNETIVFAGDGINDAPVLTSVDVGIAMGALGSDAAIEAADVVIMDDKLTKIAVAIKHSKKCMSIVWANIIFALVIKATILVFATFGLATMLMGVFADVGVAILCILNSMRTLRHLGN